MKTFIHLNVSRVVVFALLFFLSSGFACDELIISLSSACSNKNAPALAKRIALEYTSKLTYSSGFEHAEAYAPGGWIVVTPVQQDNPLRPLRVVSIIDDNTWYQIGFFSGFITTLTSDEQGRIFITGRLKRVTDEEHSWVYPRQTMMWDPAGNDGSGEWSTPEVRFPGPDETKPELGTWTAVHSPEGLMYVGGWFATGRQSDGSSVRLNGIGAWNIESDSLSALGGGVYNENKPDDLPQVKTLALDRQGRLLVGGPFTHVIQPGLEDRLEVGGIARWDPAQSRWEALGGGLSVPTESPGITERILVLGNDDIVVAGSILLQEGGIRMPLVRFDGHEWASYSEGLPGTAIAIDLRIDADGMLLLQYYSGGYRLAHRGPSAAAWTPVTVSNMSITSSSPDRAGFFVGGERLRIASRNYGAIAIWSPVSGRSLLLPGGCTRTLPLHASADPTLPEIDLYANNQPLRDNLSFLGDSSPLTFSPTAGAWLAIGPGFDDEPGAAGRAPLQFAGWSFGQADCVLAMLGVIAPPAFAGNPDGVPTDLRVVQGDVSAATGSKRSNTSVSILLLHAVSDAPRLDIRVGGTGAVLAEGLSFGQFAPVVTVDPAVHSLELRRASDGSLFRRITADLTAMGGQLVTIGLAGFVNPEANQQGPSLTAVIVDEQGATLTVPVSAEPAASGVPYTFALLGNYPNPFNPQTTILYSLEHPERVRIEVFDISGKRVMTLVDEQKTAGRHEAFFDGSGIPSGTYLYRLIAGGKTAGSSLVLIR
jgi:hypothetical protein